MTAMAAATGERGEAGGSFGGEGASLGARLERFESAARAARAAARDPEERAYVERCLRIDPDDLDGEFCRLPGDLAYWNARAARALREVLRAKHELAVARARAYVRAREEAEGRVTVAELERRVELDPDVSEAELELADLEAERARLRGIADAVAAKKDILQSLGAKMRAELEASPSLRRRLAEPGGFDPSGGYEWARAEDV